MPLFLFLRGLVGVLIVFAATTYAVTQSAWMAFNQTVICAILLQFGYFAYVVYLIWQSHSIQTSETLESEIQPRSANASPALKVGRLPNIPRSHRS